MESTSGTARIPPLGGSRDLIAERDANPKRGQASAGYSLKNVVLAMAGRKQHGE
jgi:hypothetical protein